VYLKNQLENSMLLFHHEIPGQKMTLGCLYSLSKFPLLHAEQQGATSQL